MLDLNLLYKNFQNQYMEIDQSRPQYLYLEPFEKVVIRYYFEKDGLEIDNPKIMNEVVDLDFLKVKIRVPDSTLLSRLSDFTNIENRTSNTIYFELNFDKQDRTTIDVLYESTTSEKLRIKVRTFDVKQGEDDFENENTVTDGRDAYVRLVNVQINPSRVSYIYIFRRNGRLKQSPGQTDYAVLTNIFLQRFTSVDDPNKSLSIDSIVRGMQSEGWLVDISGGRIYKQIGQKETEITPDEINFIIRKYADIRDILNLLSTVRDNGALHVLIKEAEKYLIDCDGYCSIRPANPQNVVDTRNNR